MAKKGKVKFPESREQIERSYHPRRHQYVFLIFCEDEKTEKAYFEEFNLLIPMGTIFLEVYGKGLGPLELVKFAITRKQAFEEEHGISPDQVWAVFDVDDADKVEYPTRSQHFREAISLADTNKINRAYSHEVFELWLLLHFQEVSPEQKLPRKQVYSLLEKAIQEHCSAVHNFQYEHGKVSVLEHVSQCGNEVNATQRAKALDAHWTREGVDLLHSNPRTHVYKLVEEIRVWIEYYSYTPN